MNRRDFLKLALMSTGLFATAAFPSLQVAAAPVIPPVTAPPARPATTTTSVSSTLPIPRSLMLHSRHHKQLPDLVEYLITQGYAGITYDQFYRALQGDFRLPPNPFLLTIDDLSMTRGNPAFKVFAGMKQTLDSYGFKGNFAIITRPDQPQDDDLWAEVKSWGEAGFGLESHTSYHSNLSDPNWIADDYEAEIVDSAHEIRQRTGQPVRALVTPFGSGYDTETGILLPGVAAACRKAHSPLVVGIVGGRTPIQLPVERRAVYYLGRCTMGIQDTNASGIWEIEHWA